MALHFTCLDYEDVRVSCDADVWRRHILREHPELAEYEPVVRQAISSPWRVYRDRQHHNRKVFYRLLAMPSQPGLACLKVVVRYGESGGVGHGWVVTAYIAFRVREEGVPLWTS